MAKPEYGIFKNGIPFARFGNGGKDLVLFTGGPGAMIPKGLGLQMFTTGLGALTEEFTIHIVARKPGLHEGYTTKDMSDDYADLIREEFAGGVELVVGMSYGGLIVQHFAADHADLFQHVVIAMAAHKISPAGRELDRRFAELFSQGKEREACAQLADALGPMPVPRQLIAGLMWLGGSAMLGSQTDTSKEDILIEAAAELAHDASESLKRIRVPVLILCGGADFYFPVEYVKEMAAQIENSTLILYEGKGHGIISEKRFSQDIMEFMSQTRGDPR